LSIAEQNNGGREKPSLVSSSFEAIMGAIYLESGFNIVTTVAISLIETVYNKIDIKTLSKDYKTELQEITQAKYGVTPEYKLIDSYGPDHKKEFKIAVIVNGKELAIARGISKKKAEQESARIALGIESH
jgi:ribonuclease-3